jgi:hypothetical protein
MHFRFAPKATVGHQDWIHHFVPQAVMTYSITSSARPTRGGELQGRSAPAVFELTADIAW